MKKLIAPIILTILSVVVIIVSINYVNKYKEAENNGTLTIILLDNELNEISNKNHKFEKGSSFIEIIKSNYDVTLGSGSQEGMILKIDSLEANNISEEFIKIYINCKPSNKGIKLIAPEDGAIYRFVIEKVSSTGNLQDEFC